MDLQLIIDTWTTNKDRSNTAFNVPCSVPKASIVTLHKVTRNTTCSYYETIFKRKGFIIFNGNARLRSVPG